MVLMKKIMKESRKRMEAKLQSETDGGVELDEKTDHYELVQKRGAIIKDNKNSKEREEKMQYLFEDADFSLYRIKELIAEGEKNAENAIAKKGVEII